MLFVLLFFIAFFSAAASEIWTRNSGVYHWYLALEGDDFSLNIAFLSVIMMTFEFCYPPSILLCTIIQGNFGTFYWRFNLKSWRYAAIFLFLVCLIWKLPHVWVPQWQLLSSLGLMWCFMVIHLVTFTFWPWLVVICCSSRCSNPWRHSLI